MSDRGDSDITKWEIITVFRETEDLVLTTAEVAAELPIGKRTVQKRLKKLLKDNKVKRKEVGSNAVVWWLDDILVDDIPGVNVEETKTIYHHWPVQLSLSESIILSSLDIPGDISKTSERRRAIIRAYLLLRERKEVAKREFIDELFFEYQAGYSNQYSWWEKLIRKNLKKLSPVVKAPKGGKWKFEIDEDFLPDQTRIIKTGNDPTPIGGQITEKIDAPPDDWELLRLVLSDWESNLRDQGESRPGYPGARTRYINGKDAIAWLIRERKATKDEFIKELFPTTTADDVEYWWGECVEPAIEIAISYGYIEHTYEGYISRFPIPK